ncbi:MAG: c-type cytochrome [Phototrophicaceae bacterium]
MRNTLVFALFVAILSAVGCGRQLPDVVPTTVMEVVTQAPTTVVAEATVEAEVTAEVEATAETGDDWATLIANADPANGEVLFGTFYAEASFACSNCHNNASEDRLVGPGLLSIAERATTRVDGISAEEYIFTSILLPNDYVVETYVADLMPKVYGDLLSEQEQYDLVAYLLTLQ